MATTSKKTKRPAKPAKRKVAIKDLKAKDAGSVKGGVISNLSVQKHHSTYSGVTSNLSELRQHSTYGGN